MTVQEILKKELLNIKSKTLLEGLGLKKYLKIFKSRL